MIVDGDRARRIVQGQSVAGEPPATGGGEAPLCRAYSLDGDFLAIMTYHATTGQWRPKKVFAAS
jgi:hypothetical protein